MTAALMLAYAGFAFVTSITPGPNNAMLLASGLNYGFRRTVPHIAGVSLGCAAMLVLVGLGLGAVFAAVPVVYTSLRYVGAGYLLWLAWHIAWSGPMADCQGGAGPRGSGRPQGGGRPQGRPMTFWQAAAFQWVNPKAWILVVGAVSTYAPRDGFALNVALLAVLLGLINAPSVSVWAGFGVMLRPWLSDPRRVRVFNVAMAALLVLSLLPILEG